MPTTNIKDNLKKQLKVENTPIEFKEKFITYQAEIFAENVVIRPYDYIFAAKYVYVLSQVFSGSKPETSNFIDLKGYIQVPFPSKKYDPRP